MQSYIFYHDKKVIITEVYTIVFDSSRTSTNQVVGKLG